MPQESGNGMGEGCEATLSDVRPQAIPRSTTKNGRLHERIALRSNALFRLKPKQGLSSEVACRKWNRRSWNSKMNNVMAPRRMRCAWAKLMNEGSRRWYRIWAACTGE